MSSSSTPSNATNESPPNGRYKPYATYNLQAYGNYFTNTGIQSAGSLLRWGPFGNHGWSRARQLLETQEFYLGGTGQRLPRPGASPAQSQIARPTSVANAKANEDTESETDSNFSYRATGACYPRAIYTPIYAKGKALSKEIRERRAAKKKADEAARKAEQVEAESKRLETYREGFEAARDFDEEDDDAFLGPDFK